MAQPFSFGFSGDDIEIDPDDVQETSHVTECGVEAPESSGPPPLKPQKHDIEELLSTIPSKISYSILEVESPQGSKIRLPRRELFDVRMQLMAEDDDDEGTSEALTGLDNSDIRTNVYEGGFKSWECSIDLVKFLLDRGPRKDLDDLCRVDHVIEMGCGTSLPTLTLFHHALLNSLPLYITLTDYNASVLRLVTLPNLLLTYAQTLPSTNAPFSPESPNPLRDSSTLTGDLDITDDLKSAFLRALQEQQLVITLISGSWSPPTDFLALAPSVPELRTFVLASETIYSPASLIGFTDALVALLGRVKAGKAIVGAKRIYFGVGGGVDAFKEECARRGAVVTEVDSEAWGLGQEGTGGVRRAVVEVQMM